MRIFYWGMALVGQLSVSGLSAEPNHGPKLSGSSSHTTATQEAEYFPFDGGIHRGGLPKRYLPDDPNRLELFHEGLTQRDPWLCRYDEAGVRNLYYEAVEKFKQLPESEKKTYRDRYNAAARKELDQILAGVWGEGQLMSFARRFRFTDAGDEAIERLISDLIDRGAFEAASTYLPQYFEEHPEKISGPKANPEFVIKAIFALVQDDKRDAASELIKKTGLTNIEIAGESQNISSILEHRIPRDKAVAFQKFFKPQMYASLYTNNQLGRANICSDLAHHFLKEAVSYFDPAELSQNAMMMAVNNYLLSKSPLDPKRAVKEQEDEVNYLTRAGDSYDRYAAFLLLLKREKEDGPASPGLVRLLGEKNQTLRDTLFIDLHNSELSPRTVDAALKNLDPLTHNFAVYLLAVKGVEHKDTQNVLQAMVRSKSSAERNAALDPLVREYPDDMGTVSTLMETISPGDSLYSKRVIMALSRMAEVSPKILELIKSQLKDPQPSVRKKAANVLETVPEALPTLLKHTNDESPEVRAAIYDGIGWLARKGRPDPDPVALQALRRGFRDKEVLVRKSVLSALDHWPETRQPSQLSLIRAGMKDAEVSIRIQAAEMATQLKENEEMVGTGFKLLWELARAEKAKKQQGPAWLTLARLDYHRKVIFTEYLKRLNPETADALLGEVYGEP